MRDAAGLKVQLARAYVRRGLDGTAAELSDGVLAAIGDEPDELLVDALLVRASVGSRAKELELADRALQVAEALRVPSRLADALMIGGVGLQSVGRHEEARALLSHAVGFALDHDLIAVAIRAGHNLSESIAYAGRLDQAQAEIDRVLQLARDRGDRFLESATTEQRTMILDFSGRWSEAADAMAQSVGAPWASAIGATVLCERGDHTVLRALLERTADPDSEPLDPERDSINRVLRAALARAGGDAVTGLEQAVRAFDLMAKESGTTTVLALRELRLCALAAGERAQLEAALTPTEARPARLLLSAARGRGGARPRAARRARRRRGRVRPRSRAPPRARHAVRPRPGLARPRRGAARAR